MFASRQTLDLTTFSTQDNITQEHFRKLLEFNKKRRHRSSIVIPIETPARA